MVKSYIKFIIIVGNFQQGDNMAMNISDYQFDGPFPNTHSLQNRGGVYGIVSNQSGNYTLIDVGQSKTVRDRVENHDRESCWKRRNTGRLEYCAYYTSQDSRDRIEKELRKKLNPPCGER